MVSCTYIVHLCCNLYVPQPFTRVHPTTPDPTAFLRLWTHYNDGHEQRATGRGNSGDAQFAKPEAKEDG